MIQTYLLLINLPETPDNANNINIGTYETNFESRVRRCRLLPENTMKKRKYFNFK